MAEGELFSREVGLRLRAVRRQRGMTLEDVERASDGRWSASAVGAYERGFRNLSLPRLRELADFYGVPMALLLGESERTVVPDAPSRVVLDLTALEGQPDAGAVQRYAHAILTERGDWNGRVLSIRRDDVRALCAVLQIPEDVLVERLREWGALAVSGPLVSVGDAGSGE